MGEAKFINFQGVQILRIIFPDGSLKKDVLETLENAKQIIDSQPPDSVYTLTFLGEFRYDKEITAAFKEYIAHNKPFVRAAAVVGVTGLKKVIYNSFMYFTQRSVIACDTEQEGLDFLFAENKINQASA